MPDTLEPSDDFNSLIAATFGEVAPIPDDYFTDYTLLSTVVLVEQFNTVRDKLRATGQMLDPKTPEAIDLHGLYHGLLLEKRRRGLA